MEAIRRVYDQLPEAISVPAALRRRRVEVIMLPLEEEATVSARPAPRFAPVKVRKIEILSREERNARR